MNIEDLRKDSNKIEQVNIISNEGDIYIAELQYHDHRDVLLDGSGSPKSFSSIAELKEALESSGVTKFNLVFDSPYDEMC